MDRRQLLPLLGVTLLAILGSYLLTNARPIGRNIGTSPAAVGVLEDQRSPRTQTGNASLTVVLFTDYQCPVCRRAEPGLEAAVARDGNVTLIYKEWPIFGERSVRAAQVALAANLQGIYPTVHHQLMKSPNLDDAAMRDAVELSGGNWQQLQADLVTHGAAIEDQIAVNNRDAFQLGLQGTPDYLIGTFLVQGALTEREFLRAFEQARSQG